MKGESLGLWLNVAQLHEEASLPSGLQPALVFNPNLKGEGFINSKLKSLDSILLGNSI